MMRVTDSTVPTANARCTASEDAWHYVRRSVSDDRYFICIFCLTIGPEEEFEQLGAKPYKRYRIVEMPL